jgi:hypothetical protein
MSQDNREAVVEMINEKGETEPFEHIMTLEYKDRVYMIMHPAAEEGPEQAEEDEVVVFSVTEEDGEALYEIVQDEKLAQEVFDEFLMILEADEESE